MQVPDCVKLYMLHVLLVAQENLNLPALFLQPRKISFQVTGHIPTYLGTPYIKIKKNVETHFVHIIIIKLKLKK